MTLESIEKRRVGKNRLQLKSKSDKNVWATRTYNNEILGIRCFRASKIEMARRIKNTTKR